VKKLGIIGGTSWNSTALYYDHINREVARRLGGLASARLSLESLNLADYAACLQSGRIDDAEKLIVAAGQNLKGAGADAFLIASNTTNRFAAAVERETGLECLESVGPRSRR
jgi:aspartate racemase